MAIVVTGYFACPLAATAIPTPDGAVVAVRTAEGGDPICDVALSYDELFALLQGAEVLLRAGVGEAMAGATRAA